MRTFVSWGFDEFVVFFWGSNCIRLLSLTFVPFSIKDNCIRGLLRSFVFTFFYIVYFCVRCLSRTFVF